MEIEEAVFAGGCFWCVQDDFDQLKGVLKTETGYCGGKGAHPTYEEVASGKTGYVESVHVDYNPQLISYQELVAFYFHHIDPTQSDGQFYDKGSEYRPVIFYTNATQKEVAEEYKARLIKEAKVLPIVVDILPATTFYPAEATHQNYAKNNPLRYKFYRKRCGRDQRLGELWKE